MVMKIAEFTKKYNFEADFVQSVFSKYQPEYVKWSTWDGWRIEDNHIEEALSLVRSEFAIGEKEKIKIAEEAEKAKKIKDEEDEKANKLKDEIQRTKNAKLANMLITSGFNFDGYTIVKYSGYISGDDAVEIDRGTSGAFFKANQAVNVKDMLMDSLAVIRRNALQELKEKAYDLGCNAVIGVDFDYINLDPETANVHGGTTYLPYIFGVTANGNAVIIKKNDE